MLRKELFALVILLSIAVSWDGFSQESGHHASPFTAGLLTGYNSGYGFHANIKVNDFAEEFPFELRLGLGYSIRNPGNAADARRIFINNATNGVPEKKGTGFDYRLDFLLPKPIFSVTRSYLVFGPRYSSFKGNFKFIGGNEDFDVKSKQWGLGGGIENHFRMTPKIDLTLALGLDYFFPGTLSGHDTSYSPDNDNVNSRKDNQNENVRFEYKDADKAIKQPKFVPRAMIGVSFGL